MFDLKKSFSSLVRELPVATGQSVAKEGLCLVKVMESGVAKVKPSTGASTDIFCGFSTSDNESITTQPRVEQVTVPSSSPYTIQLSSTTPAGSGPASYEIRVYNASTTTEFSQVATIVGANQFVLSSTGVLTVSGTYAGDTLDVYWRVNLSALEAQTLFYQRHPNNTAGSILNQVGVMCGHGEMYTYQYNASVNWGSVTAGNVICGASGIVTSGAAGSYNTVGEIIKVPDTSDASLGIAFNVNKI